MTDYAKAAALFEQLTTAERRQFLDDLLRYVLARNIRHAPEAVTGPAAQPEPTTAPARPALRVVRGAV